MRGPGERWSASAVYTIGALSVGLNADVLSHGRTPGAFMRASVEGSLLDMRDTLNHACDGQAVTPPGILVRGRVANKKAHALRAAVQSAAR